MTSRLSPTRLTRRSFLVGGAAGVAAPLLLRVPSAFAQSDDGARAFGFPPTDLTTVVTRPIMFPVVGTVNWTDTFGACRDGCARKHEGQDLLGKKLQKLVACVDGTVVALRHESDGNSLYLEDKDGWYYSYLHINNDTPDTDDGKNPMQWAFAPGLKEGDTVTKGQFVAYMGDSGNAEDGPAHCHFEIRKPTSKGVWSSQAVNPKASLKAATAAAVTDDQPAQFTKSGPFVPFGSAAALITQQYQDFLGRDPSAGSLALNQAGLEANTTTAARFITGILNADENQASAGAIVRLYQAYFTRDPDYGGFSYWLDALRNGGKADDISGAFASSSEFRRTYGSLTNTQFVSTVYQNVLGRQSDADGQAYWVDQLDRKLIGRGKLMLRFSESSEYQQKLANRVQVFLMNAQMLHVAPSAPLMAIREKQLETSSITIEALVDDIRLSSDYAKRLG